LAPAKQALDMNLLEDFFASAINVGLKKISNFDRTRN
jgi:hypothetical protein